MTIVLPHGVLFRGGEEGEIRKNLIENNHIDAVIGLPANIFFGTGIPTIIMVLKQKRENTDVLIIDASKGFEKVGKNNKLRASDIKKVADVVTRRVSVAKFSKVVSRDEIRSNDYNLNIPRYVDSSEKPESWDIYASMFGGIPAKEIDELDDFWKAFPGLRASLFERKNDAYYTLKVSDIKKVIQEHPDVDSFTKHYNSAFDGFDEYLYSELMQTMSGVNISKEEAILSENIFTRLKDIPLVDVYEAYQVLDNDWNKIAVDLEIVQTEGFAATKQVDPNMIVKKKDGKDQEVQDGWIGHVIPFELAQQKLLYDELESLKADEERLAEISSAYDEALESLPEEEKEKEFINEDKTAFVWAEVKKTIKSKDVDEEILAVLKKASADNEEEKKLKKQVKEKSEKLHMNTKKLIESLSDDQVMDLLKDKWILPLINGLSGIPESIIAGLITKLLSLAEKYSTTLSEVEDQIVNTEKELSEMIDMLSGDEFDMQGLSELKKMLGGI